MSRFKNISSLFLILMGLALAGLGGWNIYTWAQGQGDEVEILEEIPPQQVSVEPTPVLEQGEWILPDPSDVEGQEGETVSMASPVAAVTPTHGAALAQEAEISESPSTAIPDRLVISSIGLDAPVLLAGTQRVRIAGQEFTQWTTPEEFAVGWSPDSAPLGQPGNTVLNGHHNVNGKVFENLHNVKVGDPVIIYSEGLAFTYEVTNQVLLKEKNVSLQERSDNAWWILPSVDERITLVTCWPADSNTHRLVVVARPLSYAQEFASLR